MREAIEYLESDEYFKKRKTYAMDYHIHGMQKMFTTKDDYWGCDIRLKTPGYCKCALPHKQYASMPPTEEELDIYLETGICPRVYTSIPPLTEEQLMLANIMRTPINVEE
jgi:hypothetical protein